MKWDDLESELEANKRDSKPKCGVRVMLDELPVEALDAVENALARPEFSGRNLYEVLRQKLGAAVPSQWSIGNHRRGACSCGREAR